MRYMCVACTIETNEIVCHHCGGYKHIMNENEAREYLGYNWFEEEENGK